MVNTYKGEVIRVLDGDTFEAIVELGFGVVQKFRIRLEGIDTPEIRGKGKKKGLAVKKIVQDLIENKEVFLIEAEDKDKFGRALARVQLSDGRDLTELLIEQGLGKRYSGGKKLFCSMLAI